MLSRAILRRPGPDFARGLTTARGGAPHFKLLLEQHAAYANALDRLGLQVEILDALSSFPDAWFVEDCAVIVPELAVITRPGAPERRGEEEAMLPVLARHRPLARIEAPGTLEGGDVLIVDRQVWVGLSGRTNSAGAHQLAALLEPLGYAVHLVPVASGLHLKTSVTHVGNAAFLVTAQLAHRAEFASSEQHLVVPVGEEAAANTLLVDGTLLVPRGFPKTHALLRGRPFPVLELDISEAQKMDGGLTCMSLRF